MLDQILTSVSPGPQYESADSSILAPAKKLVRLIAFYLPQFHPIAENNEWWGNGFTEWTNVTKAVPRFRGHYQPRLPADLGFYDLRLPANLKAQAALAKRYGIEGFCFHHYWFQGKQLLETPIQILLSNTDIDLPFCVNWANENWTRRWDGFEREVLMAQQHSPEDDLAFATSLEPLFRDPRYIRIDGRPLLMLYRPGALPDARATVRLWRQHFLRVGAGDLYIVMAQAFGDGDPARYGMDAAVGFPPLWTGSTLPRLQRSLELLDPKFRGEVVDYEALADTAIAAHPFDIKVFPGVCPSWDNEPRRPGRGFSVIGSTPAKYGRWLRAASNIALQAEHPDERIVFINAWNEWAEGAYLEPDRHFGHAYLAETARVLNGLGVSSPEGGNPGRQARAFTHTVRRKSLAERGTRKVLNKLADTMDSAANKLRQL